MSDPERTKRLLRLLQRGEEGDETAKAQYRTELERMDMKELLESWEETLKLEPEKAQQALRELIREGYLKEAA